MSKLNYKNMIYIYIAESWGGLRDKVSKEEEIFPTKVGSLATRLSVPHKQEIRSASLINRKLKRATCFREKQTKLRLLRFSRQQH